jgi:hypothetical protein
MDAHQCVGAPRSMFRERKPPKKFPNYTTLMSNIIDSKPSSYQGEID